MSVEANKAVVRRFMDEALQGRPEVFDEICSPGFVNQHAEIVADRPVLGDPPVDHPKHVRQLDRQPCLEN